MAMNGEKAALALVGVGEIFQIMASMLPSPTTMMQGGGDPERIKQLRRNRMQGAVISTLLLGGVSYFVGQEDRSQGIILFAAGMGTLAIFMFESERALRKAENGAGRSGGY
jgi:hypothetical protein